MAKTKQRKKTYIQNTQANKWKIETPRFDGSDLLDTTKLDNLLLSNRILQTHFRKAKASLAASLSRQEF